MANSSQPVEFMQRLGAAVLACVSEGRARESQVRDENARALLQTLPVELKVPK